MMKYLYSLFALFLSLGGWAQGTALQAPHSLRAVAHQHEIELSWQDDNTDLDGLSWQVVVGEQVINTSQKSCVIEGLDANESYDIKVYARHQGQQSEAGELSTKTKALAKEVNDLGRIPYLRTVSVQGKCPQFLPLYYNDLANAKAQITYKLNGKAVQPKDSKIELNPESVRETLEININEGEGRVWRIIYYLHVRK